jgi:hypothetical protein
VAPKPIDLSRTVRNGNYPRTGCAVALLAIAALWINLVSSWGLEWLGVAVQVILTAWAVALFVLWRRATLQVDDASVQVGGFMHTTVIPWAEVSSFCIRDPEDRTLFVWVFAPRKTQGRLILRDGTSLRIRAIEPWAHVIVRRKSLVRPC